MSRTEQSEVHAYSQTLREIKTKCDRLEAENESLRRTINGVRAILENTLSIDNTLSVIHKIRQLIK